MGCSPNPYIGIQSLTVGLMRESPGSTYIKKPSPHQAHIIDVEDFVPSYLILWISVCQKPHAPIIGDIRN